MASCGLWATAAAQSSPRLNIPDPTPTRRPGPDQLDATVQMEKVKEQQERLVRDALRHKQVIKDIDKMAVLARQMQDELKSTNPDGRNSQRAAEIEKLAEDIKSLEKQHW